MTALRLLTLAGLVVALGCTTSPSGTAPAPASPSPASPSPFLAPGTPAQALEGDARFPAELAADGHVIPTGIGSYRVQQASTDLPVPGAVVTARDPVTRAALPVPTATTDAQGHFRLEGLAPGENHLIEVYFRAADGSRDFRLLALGRVGEPVSVSWRSTSVVAAVLAQPDKPDLKHLDLAPVRAAEAVRQTELEALSSEKKLELLDTLLTAPTGTGILPLPSVPPLPIVSALPSALPSTGLITTVASTVPSLRPVSTVASLLPSVLPSLAPVLTPSTPAPSATTVVDTVTDVVDDVTDNLPLPLPSIKKIL